MNMQGIPDSLELRLQQEGDGRWLSDGTAESGRAAEM